MPADFDELAYLERTLGPPPIDVKTPTRSLVRRWLRLNGVQGVVCDRLTLRELGAAYGNPAVLASLQLQDKLVFTRADLLQLALAIQDWTCAHPGRALTTAQLEALRLTL